MVSKANDSKQTEQKNGHLNILNVFTSKATFELIASPEVFKMKWSPESRLEFKIDIKPQADDHYLVSFCLNITTTLDKKEVYKVSIDQSGLFLMEGFDEKQRDFVLNTYCPHLLFPYARERLSSLITQGGFQNILLTPINFESLYQEKQKYEKEQKAKLMEKTPEIVN